MRKQRLIAACAVALAVLGGCGSASPEMAPMSPAEAPRGDSAGGAPGAVTLSAQETVALDSGGYYGGEESGNRRYANAKSQAAAVPAPVAAAPPPPPPPQGPPPKPTGVAGTTPQGPASGEVAVQQSPMLIYTAVLTMAVFDVGPTLGKIEELAKSQAGFLAKREDMSITIRVPVGKFEATLKAIEQVGDMLHRNVTAQDVTEEFRDLEVRLKGAKAVQERLAQLLQKAQKVEESIAIERELDRITAEIDRVEGRMKFLKDRAAYSTITVVFQTKSAEHMSNSPFRLPTPWLGQLGLSRLLSL